MKKIEMVAVFGKITFFLKIRENLISFIDHMYFIWLVSILEKKVTSRTPSKIKSYLLGAIFKQIFSVLRWIEANSKLFLLFLKFPFWSFHSYEEPILFSKILKNLYPLVVHMKSDFKKLEGQYTLECKF